jgi:hypothetical protein
MRIRVEILRTDIAHLKGTPRPWYGHIIAKDGAYLTVKPLNKRWEIELYPNEVREL